MFCHVISHLECTRVSVFLGAWALLWCHIFIFFIPDLIFWMCSFAPHMVCLCGADMITSISLVCYLEWFLFHSTQSVYFTPLPPNRSKALNKIHVISSISVNLVLLKKYNKSPPSHHNLWLLSSELKAILIDLSPIIIHFRLDFVWHLISSLA